MKMRREMRLLVVAVVVMAIGALALLALLGQASRSLHAAHEDVVDSAVPSIVALDGAQARLRQIHALVLERRLGAGGDPALRDAAIASARGELGRAVDAYLAQRAEPGEPALQNEIRESLAALNSVEDRALMLDPGAREQPGVRRDLDAAVARLSADLVRASEFNAEVARASAARVREVSRTDLRAAAVPIALTFAAAALTLALTYRAVRRAEALAARSLDSLERRAEELESFAGRVAHDLLSPLMSVALALELAGRRLDEPDDAATQGAVARASRTLQRVRRFVSDLLEFARAGAKPPPGVQARVGEAVHEIAEELGPVAHDAGVDLRVEAAATDRVVACSPGVLTSVLGNLVQNAIKYIGEGDVRRVAIRTVDLKDEVRLEVEDTGPGVPPTERERLFARHGRGRAAQAPGRGGGRAPGPRRGAAPGAHGGVEPGPGRGSVFWFSIPAAA